MTRLLSAPARRWWIPLALIIGLCCAYGASQWLKAEPVGVATGKAGYQDVDASVSTTGKVVPVNEFQARASFSGVVEKVFVHVGDQVQPGQMLVKMKDPFAAQRVAAATVGLLAAQENRENVTHGGSQEERINSAAERRHAQLEQTAAANALASLQQLQQSGAASQAEINGATKRLEDANATVQMLNDRSEKRFSNEDKATWAMRVVDARASLQAEKTSLANANITSPIAGTVNLIPVSPNDFVNAGADLVHIADPNRIEIRAFFDEPDIGKLHVGQQVSIFWEGAMDKSWVGHIKYAPLAVTVSGRRNVGDCTIDVDDPRGQLLPNTNVNVSTVYVRRKGVLTIPREALHTDGPATYVFRVVGDRLVQTPVEVGVVNLDRVEVKKGFGVEDTFALHAVDNSVLRDGLKIKPVQQKIAGISLPRFTFRPTASGGSSL